MGTTAASSGAISTPRLYVNMPPLENPEAYTRSASTHRSVRRRCSSRLAHPTSSAHVVQSQPAASHPPARAPPGRSLRCPAVSAP